MKSMLYEYAAQVFVHAGVSKVLQSICIGQYNQLLQTEHDFEKSASEVTMFNITNLFSACVSK